MFICSIFNPSFAFEKDDRYEVIWANSKDVSYIEFNALLDVKEVNWQKRKFLDLLSEVDHYGADGFLVWYPKKKCLAFADYEHEAFRELCSMQEFLENPAAQIDKIFE